MIIYLIFVDPTQSTQNPLAHESAQYVLSEKMFEDEELVRVCMMSLIETTGILLQ